MHFSSHWDLYIVFFLHIIIVNAKVAHIFEVACMFHALAYTVLGFYTWPRIDQGFNT